ncbi:class IV adenylate cyclase [Salinisphaera sp. T31B1]|uniref:class IV adenylate cyclase n=1 Tax=Salinisphaera sp. T31B1 TaxID=727963 RepID=UPI00333E2D3A
MPNTTHVGEDVARNIEIKARLADRDRLEACLAGMAADGPYEIRQKDTFLVCSNGRLKVRDFGDGHGELIGYRRDDVAGLRASCYRRTPTSDPAGLVATLADALGIRGVVNKTRTLYLLGRTRVHVDRVAGLGDFVELEVVLAANAHLSTGRDEARRLMQTLAIDASALVEGAYIDLITAVPCR